MPRAKDAGRRGSGKVCRNSFAGLVMLPGLDFSPFTLASSATRPGSKRFLAQSDSRQPLPEPRRPAWANAGVRKNHSIPEAI